MLRFRWMAALPFLASLSCSSSTPLFAQDILPPAKLLVISREYTKPGRDGASHQAVEAAYPKVLAVGKMPSHYYAAVSLSGPPRVLFFHGYESYAEWAAQRQGTAGNSALATTLARTTAADGDLLSSKDFSVWMKRDDLSLNPGFRVGARVEVIIQYQVRPGHGQEFEDLVKLYTEGYKDVPTCIGVPMKRFMVLPATPSWSSSRIRLRRSWTPRTITIRSSPTRWEQRD